MDVAKLMAIVIVSVRGRRSCRFLLHLSVPEGLRTLCTEFGGVAQNAKWTLAAETVVRATPRRPLTGRAQLSPQSTVGRAVAADASVDTGGVGWNMMPRRTQMHVNKTLTLVFRT
ncbi:hypothetical protein F2P81_007894 [Scophthalmus maximus]|uniref:Uncharacterized protein n=1 Tax=Scophthalmus maximus TaxID=52904 RepID=A0A6A4T437_SCOMX|nr:hypothetical protein F2P81_007894 [Scophthalmus maximus]